MKETQTFISRIAYTARVTDVLKTLAILYGIDSISMKQPVNAFLTDSDN